MMELPGDNFFEVTISSRKLFSYMQELKDQMGKHEKKMQDIANFNNNFEDILFKKVAKRMNEVAVDGERRCRENAEAVNHLKLLLRDHEKKGDQKF